MSDPNKIKIAKLKKKLKELEKQTKEYDNKLEKQQEIIDEDIEEIRQIFEDPSKSGKPSGERKESGGSSYPKNSPAMRQESDEDPEKYKHVTIRGEYDDSDDDFLQESEEPVNSGKSDEPAKSTKSKKPTAFRRAFNANVSKPPKPPKTGKSGNLRF